MKFDSYILGAIETACDEIGMADLAERVGVSWQTIQQARNGLVNGCRDEVWERLWDVLVEKGDFDPHDYQYWPQSKLRKMTDDIKLQAEKQASLEYGDRQHEQAIELALREQERRGDTEAYLYLMEKVSRCDIDSVMFLTTLIDTLEASGKLNIRPAPVVDTVPEARSNPFNREPKPQAAKPPPAPPPATTDYQDY